MSRINTNISSLVAQTNLTRANDQLQTSLTRLSTGLRINTGKDDPAGLIASENLRSDITAVQKGITNSQRANQILSTADSALGQVSSLLNDLRGLVTESANTGALSTAQIQANQLQVDSSLAAIDRIAQTTSFQGRRLLDGSLDFITSSVAAGFATKTVTGTADTAASLTVAHVTLTANQTGSAGNGYTFNIQSGAALGSETATFNSGTKTITVNIASGSSSAANIIAAITQKSSITNLFTAVNSTNSTAGEGAATGTTTNGADGNVFVVSAVTGGTAFNGAKVTITSGAVGASGTTASYNASTKTLTVVATSTSTASQIITAINGEGHFKGTLLNSNGLGTGVSASTTTLAGATGGSNSLSGLKINQANFGTASNVAVQVDIDTQAKQASLTYSSGDLASGLVLELGGSKGFNTFNFGAGTTLQQLQDGINQLSDTTGVQATVNGGNLVLTSSDYGSKAFVSARALSGTFSTGDGSNVAATRSSGADVSLRINGLQATGDGLNASLNSSTLNLSFSVDASAQDGDTLSFSIDGGGANFQLGPDVISSQQARLGIQSVSTAQLGGKDGKLFELASGGSKALNTDPNGAAAVVTDVIDSITTLRGRIGAFQKTALDTNISTLTDTLSNLTDAQSSIRDADFAAESANLTRAQILVQAGTSVLQISNQRPQAILALLRQ